MNKKINAMKQALHQMTLELWNWNSTASTDEKRRAFAVLEEAIESEEAQTVEPIGQRVNNATLGHPIVWWREVEPGTLLFTHPAPATEPAKPTGERETLIERLRGINGFSTFMVIHKAIKEAADMLAADELIERLRESAKEIATSGHAGWGNVCTDAANMLAADAQAISNLLARIHRDGGHYEAEHGVRKALADADLIVSKLNALSDTQQVAVPQGLMKIEVTEAMHIAAIKVLHRATGSDCLPQRMLDAMLAASPQPPQAAESRVPMTEHEMHAVFVSQCDDGSAPSFPDFTTEVDLIAYIRGIEQFHGIGVKP